MFHCRNGVASLFRHVDIIIYHIDIKTSYIDYTLLTPFESLYFTNNLWHLEMLLNFEYITTGSDQSAHPYCLIRVFFLFSTLPVLTFKNVQEENEDFS